MSKPLHKRDLPPGAPRELNELLHRLHSRANHPSMRSLENATGLGHTTLSDAMTNKAKPVTKNTVVRLALALAEQGVRGSEADAELDEIDRRVADLWDRADREARPPEPDSVELAARTTWESFAGGQGPWPRVSHEVTAAMSKATFTCTSVRGNAVEVFVTADDQDTCWVLDCETDETFDSMWREEFAAHLCHRIGKLVDVHVQVLENFEIDHRPHPLRVT